MVGSMTPKCSQLMQKLAQAEFFALDIKLYLDTHPEDQKALQIYCEAVKQAKACREAFECSCYPLTADSAGCDGEWDWLCGQWL